MDDVTYARIMAQKAERQAYIDDQRREHNGEFLQERTKVRKHPSARHGKYRGRKGRMK